MATYRALDIGIDLERCEAPEYDVNAWVFLEGCKAWEMKGHSETRVGLRVCSTCGGQPRGKRYCLECDRTGLDGRVSFPGLDVDSAPNVDYPATGTICEPSELAGGVGKIRKRLARSRKVG